MSQRKRTGGSVSQMTHRYVYPIWRYESEGVRRSQYESVGVIMSQITIIVRGRNSHK